MCLVTVEQDRLKSLLFVLSAQGLVIVRGKIVTISAFSFNRVVEGVGHLLVIINPVPVI